MGMTQRIYSIMREKKMCQAAVARAAGLSPQKFNSMLRGRKIIRPEDIEPICKALECEPNDLFATPDTGQSSA